MYSQNANVDYPCITRSEGSLISCVHFYKSSKNFIVLVKKKNGEVEIQARNYVSRQKTG